MSGAAAFSFVRMEKHTECQQKEQQPLFMNGKTPEVTQNQRPLEPSRLDRELRRLIGLWENIAKSRLLLANDGCPNSESVGIAFFRCASELREAAGVP